MIKPDLFPRNHDDGFNPAPEIWGWGLSLVVKC